MRFLLLGPVQAVVADRTVRLGTRQQRLVAAVLALGANQLIPVDRLVDLLWPDSPPESARGIVRAHVSGLRAIMRRAGADRDQAHIDRGGYGYALRVDPERIDAHRFHALVARSQHAGGERRVALLDEALGLWRGPALAGTADEPVRQRLCRDLEEARLAAMEDRAEALLCLGQYRTVAAEIAGVAGEHPERQRLAEALMLALHRTGRTVVALEVFQRTARYLRHELGLDPSQRLRDLQVGMLRGGPV